MPADPIAIPARVSVACRAAGNLASLSAVAGTLNGFSLEGLAAVALARRILLADQTTASQNGIYAVTNGATVQVELGTTNGSGVFVKTGLIPGRLYWFEPPAGSYTASNGVTTINGPGFIAAADSNELTFTGPANTSLESIDVFEASLVRATEFNTAAEFPAGLEVRVDGGSGSPEWYVLAGTVATLGSSAVTFTKTTVAGITIGLAAAFDNTAAVPRTI